MASKTQKVPQGSWDHHKETILSLYLTSDLSVDELVQTMEKEHGLSATISQYEAQLRAWNARKNLKRHEWEVILQKIDSLSSQGIQSRVLISGHPVPMDRVRRARRHCKSHSHSKEQRQDEIDIRRVTSNVNSSVSIEIQNMDGNWTVHTDESGEDTASGRDQMEIDNTPELAAQEHHIETGSARDAPSRGSNTDHRFLGVTGLSASPIMSLGFASLHATDFISNNELSGNGHESFAQTMGFSTQSSQPDQPQEDGTFLASELEGRSSQPVDLALLPWGTFHLGGLPFEQFEGELASRGLGLVVRPSVMQGSRLLWESPRLVMTFLDDAVAAMTNASWKPVNQNTYGVSLTLQTLDSILPVPQRRYGNDMARPSQEMLDVELCRILLFSAANGFAGLNRSSLPIEVIPRFLDQHSNITALLLRLFRDRPGHVAKGIAENLFRATIETGDHEAIRFLLSTGLIDPNTTVCFVGDQKYTPIERIAELQKLKAVRELLLFKPNVNRTFFSYEEDRYWSRDRRGALGCLIEGLCPDKPSKRYHSAFPLEYLQAVDALIRAGAEVRVSLTCRALQKFVQMDLAEKLLHEFKPANHAMAISTDLLEAVARNLADDKAEKFITRILSDCDRTGCKQCLIQHAERVSWAIVVGARRGHIQLVKSCFGYAKCPAQILAAAITSGNYELVRFILARNPDMHAPATDIVNPPWEHLAKRSYTTPLAEAINAKDWVLAGELEAKGAFEHLDTGRRLPPTLSAVASVGNIEYMKKILLRYPQLDEDGVEDALVNAATHKEEDIFRLLLDVGVQPIYRSGQDYYYDMEPFTEVYKWGNKSLYSELISTCSDVKFRSVQRHVDKEWDNIDMLDFVSQPGMFGIRPLTEISAVAAERGDEALLHRCLELGADIFGTDDYGIDLLSSAARGHPDILRILFKHVPLTKNCIRHFGTSALVHAIRRSPYYVETLELFIAYKAIDLRSTISVYPSYYENWDSKYSPLGAAIEKDVESCDVDFRLTTRLLDSGCDINSIVRIDYDEYRRRANNTPLLTAIKTGRKGPVEFLIKRGAHVNKEATMGIRRTPIQASAENGSLDIVQSLLDNGADVNGSPARFGGGTALQFAAMSGNCNIAALLIDHGAEIFAPPSPFHGRWPIEGAAEHGRLEMIQYLWNASCIGFPIEQCLKAMELAKANGHGACADLIRELADSNGIMPTLEGCA
ncbi:hypothetical protein Hte_006238 [Hypoxylon texense]